MDAAAKTNAPKRFSNARPVGDSDALQRSVKNELVDDDDLLESEDDEESYKPRPQLPKPFVVMRTLAHLMSTTAAYKPKYVLIMSRRLGKWYH